MADFEFLQETYTNLYKRLSGTSSKAFKKLQQEELDAYLAGELDEELNKTEQGGEDVEEEGTDQALNDLLFGILRDWSYIAAGHPGPWTKHNLGQLVFREEPEKTRYFPGSTPEPIPRSHRQAGPPRRFPTTPSANTLFTVRPPRLATRLDLPRTNANAEGSNGNNRVTSSQQSQLQQNIAGQQQFSLPPSHITDPIFIASPRAVVPGASDNNTTLQPLSTHSLLTPVAVQSSSSPSASAWELSSEATLAMATPLGDTSTNLEEYPLDAQHDMPDLQPARPYTVSTPRHSSDASFANAAHGEDISTNLEPNPLDTQHSLSDSAISSNPSWLKTIPVEVYHHIATYLSRNELKACLEISKDFNRNFGPAFFERVVLQFDTETFDPVNDNDTTSSSQPRVPKLHMFQNWGAHMKKVGFALEVDEGKQHPLLIQAQKKPTFSSEDPSDQPNQTFYPRRFKWPKLHNYVDPAIKKLELVAEKTKPIQEAIARLTSVDELALSIDSGLGYLSGPDASDRVKIVVDKSEVFGRKYALSREQTLREWLEALEDKFDELPKKDKRIFQAYENCLRLAFPHNGAYLQFVLDYMLKYQRGSLKDMDQQIDKHVRKHMVDNHFLTEQERVFPHKNPVNVFARLFEKMDTKSISQQHWVPEGRIERGMRFHKRALTMYDRHQSESQSRQSEFEGDIATGPRNPDRALFVRLLCSESQTAMIFDGVDIGVDPEVETEPRLVDKPFSPGPLVPSGLTLTQMQWLKEFGWVQNAFLSSLLTAIIRNKANLTSVCTLNVSKLSSSYLSRLYDNDFWNSLPNVNKLTIMVSPEWRDIVAGYNGDFQSHPVNPSSTVSSFYQLLVALSERESINTLTLGYIGGGEHATGLFGRNKHLLAAPVVDSSKETSILTFPYVQNLTFKNCWFVPAVLKEFITRMERMELRRLRFESVSLIAAGGKWIKYQFAITGWPAGFPPQRQGIFTPMYVGYGVPQPSAYHVVPETAVIPVVVDKNGRPCLPANAVWHHQTPQQHTWAGFIDSFTPGLTVEEARAKYLAQISRKRKRDSTISSPTEPKGDKIPVIEFISCGYAKLAVQDLGDTLGSMVKLAGNSDLEKRRDNLKSSMMESDDPFLAEILPFISVHEEMLLVHAFGMRIGWGNDRRKWWNGEDGKLEGGKGRFSGMVTRKSGPLGMDVENDEDDEALWEGFMESP
ncbi:hypothetical protein MMC30_004306 [Trapelia coarctata]|nr:hypothetical protein [Trapelia coarctata]